MVSHDRYALTSLPQVDLQLYQVEFKLREAPPVG